MLTLERCRELLGDSRLSDVEVEQLRELVYNLADVAVKVAKDAAAQGRVWNPATLRWDPKPDRDPRPAEVEEDPARS